MRLEVTFKNCHSTDALRERAEQKFMKAVKHMREPIEAHMVVHVEKHRHCADLTVSSAGDTFKAQLETDDMYATIDGLMDKIERTARRRKERLQDRAHMADPTGEVDGFGLSEE